MLLCISLRLFGLGAGFGDLGAELFKFQPRLLKLDLFQLSIRVGIHNPYERRVLLVRCLLFFFLAVLPIETAECDFRRSVAVFRDEFVCSYLWLLLVLLSYLSNEEAVRP